MPDSPLVDGASSSASDALVRRTGAQLVEIPVEKVRDHPRNPRVIFRNDVIRGIAGRLKGGSFPKEHAIRVRPRDDDFELIGGHHRVRAAVLAGLTNIWAWIDDDLSDEQAFMELILDNTQGELSPLEIGLHCLVAVPKAKGGRGQRGGLSAYAARLGMKKATVSEYRQAAEVALNCSVDRTVLLDKCQHLRSIHGADSSLCQTLVEQMLKRKWSAADAAQCIAKIREFDIPRRWQEVFLPLPAVVQRSLEREFVRKGSRLDTAFFSDECDG